MYLPICNRRTVAEIQGRVIEQGKRNMFSWIFYSENDADAIATWKQDLNKIRQIFNVRSDGHV